MEIRFYIDPRPNDPHIYLKVVYVVDDDRQGLFVITAYELRGKALQAFRRRRRRK